MGSFPKMRSSDPHSLEKNKESERVTKKKKDAAVGGWCETEGKRSY